MKPHKTYDELLGLLQDRGMQIDDRKVALRALREIGYYRLSAYSYPFRKFDDAQPKTRLSEFVDGVSLESTIELYLFDEKLRRVLFDALQRVEVSLGARVAHELGKRDPEAHLSVGHLDPQRCRELNRKGEPSHRWWVKRYKSLLEAAEEEEYVKHHAKNHDGLPIWVAIGFFDFGASSRLYSMMQRPDRRKVSSGMGFGQLDWDFQSWLAALNILRNHCAHNNRIWNRSTVELPPKFTARDGAIRPIEHLDEIDRDKRRKLYMLIAVLAHVVDKVAPELEWPRKHLRPLAEEAPVVEGMDLLEVMGFPADWTDLKLWTAPS